MGKLDIESLMRDADTQDRQALVGQLQRIAEGQEAVANALSAALEILNVQATFARATTNILDTLVRMECGAASKKDILMKMREADRRVLEMQEAQRKALVEMEAEAAMDAQAEAEGDSTEADVGLPAVEDALD